MSTPLDPRPVAAAAHVKGIPSLVGTRLKLTQVDYSHVLKSVSWKRVQAQHKRVTGATIITPCTSVHVLDWSTATMDAYAAALGKAGTEAEGSGTALAVLRAKLESYTERRPRHEHPRVPETDVC